MVVNSGALACPGISVMKGDPRAFPMECSQADQEVRFYRVGLDDVRIASNNQLVDGRNNRGIEEKSFAYNVYFQAGLFASTDEIVGGGPGASMISGNRNDCAWSVFFGICRSAGKINKVFRRPGGGPESFHEGQNAYRSIQRMGPSFRYARSVPSIGGVSQSLPSAVSSRT